MKNKTLFFTLSYLLLASTYSSAAEKAGDSTRLPEHLYKLILPGSWSYLRKAEFLHLIHKSSPHHSDLTKFSYTENEARDAASSFPIAHSRPAKAVFLTSQQVTDYVKKRKGRFVVLKIETAQLLHEAKAFEESAENLLFSSKPPFDGAMEEFFHYQTQAGTLPLSCVKMVSVYNNGEMIETGCFATEKTKGKSR